MPDFTVVLQATATARVTIYDVETKEEAEEEAQIQGFDASDIEKIDENYEVVSVKKGY